MKILKRVLLILLIIILLSAIAGYFYLNSIKNAAIPNYNEDFKLENLTDQVTVKRDKFGIPHVIAQNENDLYRTVGYLMAQDRMWQMDLLRRVTQGRLSEILGKDQQKTDLLMRSLRFDEKSEKVLKISDDNVIEALEAFSDGVNQYINNHKLPPEFTILNYKPELWKPQHCANLIGYMAWDLSAGWKTEILLKQLSGVVSDHQIKDLIPLMENHPIHTFRDYNLNEEVNLSDLTLDASDNLPDLGAEIFNGSNNWAVAGKKSVTNKPILANDMHLGLFAPGIWYQMHQTVKGKLDVTGVILPGQPLVVCGHNKDIAWGMTNVMLDDLDFYAETINEDSTKYLYEGEWKDFIIKEDTIKTKESIDIPITLRFTHRGPIVNNIKTDYKKPLSIRWLGNEMSNEVLTVYRLNRAKNWTDFRNALKTMKCISQNVVYADVQGNIGLQSAAGIPIREGNGIQIYPGDSAKYDWKGLVPFEELPYEYNPERGYVASANNKTVPNDYPYYISYWYAMPNRINRIREMLTEKKQLSIEDFKNIQADVKSDKSENWTPFFIENLQAETNWNDLESEALKVLKEWNYELRRESNAATIFEVLYRKTAENLIKDDLPANLYDKLIHETIILENLLLRLKNNSTSEWVDDQTTDQVENFNDIIVKSFKETVSDLSVELGANVNDWSWEKLHTLSLNHPLGVVNILAKVFDLNRGPYGMPGSYHTVCPYRYKYDNLYKATHGASHRHIYDLSNWDNSKTIIPTGISGIPSSKHYLDQAELYINNFYHKDPFTESAIEKQAKYRHNVTPNK